jgi:hypothetical protein
VCGHTPLTEFPQDGFQGSHLPALQLQALSLQVELLLLDLQNPFLEIIYKL